MDTKIIRSDLRKALSAIDKNNYVLNSMISHIEEQCTVEELKIIEDKIFDLDLKDYKSREEFIEDYQPIFNLVDFPIADCFSVLDKRQLNYDLL